MSWRPPRSNDPGPFLDAGRPRVPSAHGRSSHTRQPARPRSPSPSLAATRVLWGQKSQRCGWWSLAVPPAGRCAGQPDKAAVMGNPGPGQGRARTVEWGPRMRSRRVVSPLSMSAFDPSVNRFKPHEPTPPVWRMHCLCSFRAGKPGQIAACECRCWWRVSRRGRWYAISRRRAFRALLPELRRDLSHFEEAGGWPPG